MIFNEGKALELDEIFSFRLLVFFKLFLFLILYCEICFFSNNGDFFFFFFGVGVFMIIGREFDRVFIDFIFRVCGLREVIEMFFLLGLVF